MMKGLDWGKYRHLGSYRVAIGGNPYKLHLSGRTIPRENDHMNGSSQNVVPEASTTERLFPLVKFTFAKLELRFEAGAPAFTGARRLI